MSQTELIRRSGLSRNHISGLENNRGAIPTMKTLCSLADALGVSVDVLLYDNLTYYKKGAIAPELERELYFLSVKELEIILLVLKIYDKHDSGKD